MGIAIADEAAAVGGLIDGGLEDPEVLLGATEREDGFGFDARATTVLRQAYEFAMCDKGRRGNIRRDHLGFMRIEGAFVCHGEMSPHSSSIFCACHII